ncbi:hypothetical protein SLEP1_g11234 [Rubroshorea leprosula]|uniref:Uncharacterized protein n=1 Tax=Rubroshorea leprosula TaxID=152421 RepID=A0AAV5IF63_9ROSI|nr:hypothetical protein SLEP1_g11234 [Rubroshorea leprosula]
MERKHSLVESIDISLSSFHLLLKLKELVVYEGICIFMRYPKPRKSNAIVISGGCKLNVLESLTTVPVHLAS